MIQTKHVKKLLFKSAQYYLSNEASQTIILAVDYEHNSYEIHAKTEPSSAVFRSEAEELAQDLLRRKHGLNFAAQKS